MSKKLSDKEREILERQRQLAARLKPPAPSGRNTSTATTTTKHKSSALGLTRKSAKSAVIDLTKPSSQVRKNPPVMQKRPSVQKRPTAQKRPISSHVPKPKPSPKVQRKAISKQNGSSSLAQLVQHVTASEVADPLDTVSAIPTVEPDDFWKHLRDWDFVAQYAAIIQQQQHQSTLDDTEDLVTRKPLPNVFLNARHYMAAWAPLCLAECRAQLIQEAMQKMTAPLLVEVQVTSSNARHRKNSAISTDASWLEGNETGGYVQVRPKHRAQARDLTFMTHDLCLLLTADYKDVIQKIRTGKVSREAIESAPTTGLIGHTEVSRQEVNGLVLKVSKRRWAKLGQKEMYLVKIGSNVTALREFTALCHVESLPLKRYLLAEHLERAENRRKLSRHQSTQNLLDKMGGTQALGSGFIEYARKKFNASQLTAVAASAHEYGEGGFTLIKGPPGTGKTTTLVAVLNSLHIRQYNKYYEEVRRIAVQPTGSRENALRLARKAKPRLLVCAPSNAAVDNIILKIMEDGFIDGQGNRYNPSMVRVGVGQSAAVRAVALETKVDAIFSENLDAGRLDSSIAGYRSELSRISIDIAQLRRKVHAISQASPWPLSKDWEIRIDEDTFDETGRVYFVNHKEKTTTYEVPPPPEPGESHFPPTAMPEYRSFLTRIVKLVENYFSVKTHLERCTIVKGALDGGANQVEVRQNLETHILNSVHMVMTTLGSAGNRTMEAADKFEVVVVDEAAQSIEPASLSAFQLGSRHAVLVGDPQQLPATIFNVTGRNSKYDRSLFQRLEEAGQPVYMLNEQYRMHPKISHFPRHIFYGGNLLDGPNVQKADYGSPLKAIVCQRLPLFQPFMILDLDSKEERGGTSLSNAAEAKLAVYLYQQLKAVSQGLSAKSKVAVITPYAQQSKLLRRSFTDVLGPQYENFVEVNTVDAFQGREANVVIFSAVRAAGSHGIGFLADVRRMNVALTRAKHFLFVIARCESIVVNPYWKDLVNHARETNAVVRVPMTSGGNGMDFGSMASWAQEHAQSEGEVSSQKPPATKSADPRKRDQHVHPATSPKSAAAKPKDPRKRNASSAESQTAGNTAKPNDPRKRERR